MNYWLSPQLVACSFDSHITPGPLDGSRHRKGFSSCNGIKKRPINQVTITSKVSVATWCEIPPSPLRQKIRKYVFFLAVKGISCTNSSSGFIHRFLAGVIFQT